MSGVPSGRGKNLETSRTDDRSARGRRQQVRSVQRRWTAKTDSPAHGSACTEQAPAAMGPRRLHPLPPTHPRQVVRAPARAAIADTQFPSVRHPVLPCARPFHRDPSAHDFLLKACPSYPSLPPLNATRVPTARHPPARTMLRASCAHVVLVNERPAAVVDRIGFSACRHRVFSAYFTIVHSVLISKTSVNLFVFTCFHEIRFLKHIFFFLTDSPVPAYLYIVNNECTPDRFPLYFFVKMLEK